MVASILIFISWKQTALKIPKEEERRERCSRGNVTQMLWSCMKKFHLVVFHIGLSSTEDLPETKTNRRKLDTFLDLIYSED